MPNGEVELKPRALHYAETVDLMFMHRCVLACRATIGQPPGPKSEVSELRRNMIRFGVDHAAASSILQRAYYEAYILPPLQLLLPPVGEVA